MSAEDVKKFMAAVDSDAQLRAKVRGTAHQICDIGNEAGYHFSESELRQHLREKWGVKQDPKYEEHDTCFFV